MPRKLPDFSGLRILVIGDVMIDRYLHGRVERISPEAPVPVIRLEREENRLGGAANVALNVNALGAEALILSVIGDDENGRTFEQCVRAAGLRTDGLVVSNQRQTTLKTRVLAQNQQLLRADREDTHPLNETENEKLLARFRELLATGTIDLIILQDYNKGCLGVTNVEAILTEAEKHDIPTAVDPKKDNFWLYRRATLFKPNLREIRDQIDFPLSPTLTSLDRAAAIIRQKLDNRFTMITLANHGVYVENGKHSARHPTQERQINDVSGAGDSVISVAACGLAAGLPLSELAILANLAGGQVVERPGVVAVNLDQLQNEYAAFTGGFTEE